MRRLRRKRWGPWSETGHQCSKARYEEPGDAPGHLLKLGTGEIDLGHHTLDYAGDRDTGDRKVGKYIA